MNTDQNKQKLDLLWNTYVEHIQKENPNTAFLDSLESMIRYLNDKNAYAQRTKLITDALIPIVTPFIREFNDRKTKKQS